MAYKVRMGKAELSGSMTTDDIAYHQDEDTLIDFSNDRIKFKTDNTSRLEIGNNRIQIKDQLVVGSVDVGTWALTVPTEDVLHVQDGNVMLQTNSADADASDLLFNKSRNATDGSVTVVQDNDKLGGITFGGSDGANYDPAASISAHVDGTPGSNDMPGRLVFSTTADGSNSTTERMRIDSSGKVGIGTDAPDYTLDVAGDIGVDQYIYHNGDADTLIQFANDKIILKAGNRTLLTTEINSSQPHEVTINDGSNNVDFVVKGNGSNAGNPLFKCDASTGRVGINGVGSPDCELHVAGDVKLHGDAPEITVRRDDNADASTIQFQGSGGVVGAYVKFLGDESGAGGTNNDLALGTGATVTERMRIRGDGNVGIGTSAPSELLAINAQSDGDECFIQFQEGGADRAKIGINTSNNFLIHNQFMNKHIVFKVNDQGNTREALRIDGAVSEVVVNQSSESLVDFRVESDNNTHMVFVDGSTDTVGINTSTPKCSLSVAGSMAMNITGINSGNDPGTTYSVAATDCVILVNTRPTAQGGIDSAITITLPDAASFPGRVITIKDSAGYCDVNAITISRAGSDTINGVDATVSLPTPASFKTLISDGSSSWQEIGN